MKKLKRKTVTRRHIEDAPFYKYQYNHDELPLDPAKPFILEQIEKIKRLKTIEFDQDLELFEYPKVNSKINIQLPQKMSRVKDRELYNFSFKPDDKSLKPLDNQISTKCPWIKDDSPELPSEYNVATVIKEIISLYVSRRMKIFHEARKKFTLYSREFKKYKTKNIALFYHTKHKSIKKTIFRAGDETLFRSTEELKLERIRMAKIIDELIEPDIKRFNNKLKLNKTKQTCFEENTKKPIKKKSLLRKSKKPSRSYVQILMPHDPEIQKEKIINNYNKQFVNANEKFSDIIKERTLHLMKLISVLHIEIYPSNLIKKIIPKIYKNIYYLNDAYKFIIKEQKLWPNICPEIILLDYLFNVENQIPLSQATLIICLLIDLQEDYRYYVKRSFLKYILNFNDERKRLQLEQEPPEFPIITIKSPVPWKASVQIAKNRLDQILMTYHPVLQAVNLIWQQLYQDLLIIDTTKFYQNDISLHAETITEMLKKSCLVARDILLNDWLPRVADLLDATRPFWQNLVSKKTTTCGRAEILFNCIHALMSYQLSEFIMRSITQLFETINQYKTTNQENKRPFMTITVAVIGKHYDDIENEIKNTDSKLNHLNDDDPSILNMTFDDDFIITEKAAHFVLKNCGKIYIDPYMEELAELFVSYFRQILRVGYNIPRLEYYMTQDTRKLSYLHCFKEDRIDMLSLYNKIRLIVNANLNGPTVYLYPIYTYYFQLLNGKMKIITENIFSKQSVPGLTVITDLMTKFHEILVGIYYLRDFVPLNLFMLDNRRVNRVLSHLVNELKDFVTNYFITLNQVENRRLCDEFESISLHAGERPSETPEVVALQNFLNECREERLYKLKSEIKTEVSKRVLFLLHYGSLDIEDIYLNSRTFLWPEELEQVLDLSAARLSVVREGLEESLKERRTKFEFYIKHEEKKVDTFRLKALRDVLTHDELKEKVKTVDELMDIMENCSREAKAINIDENLLQLDISFFPVLASIIEKMDVTEKLWRTAYQFEICYEKWFYGRYVGLNAELIAEEVDQMSKILQKLIKQLVGNPQARRLAEQIRLKLDKFKIYLPVLESICRQGMSERHWEQITQVLNIEVTPDLYPTLNSLIEIDIMSIIDKLEEISNAAGREYELNHQLVVMKDEWISVTFELLPYRDSDTHILSALDDVQTLLDDHILKAQAMRGSPYIAALGKKATDWEDKLINMQDIMDAWIQVQSTWMYLEPIFNSEDILKQMPTEGRNFKAVDRIWKKIMKNTIADTRVIQATNYPQLLEQLQKSFRDLEDIQKGLNMYLEKKRLFFARFFFLSNDELLEILSETKDPLRVQPHLKKCFEGINSLEFDQNGEITAMISAETEIVPFTKKINPNTSNGLVEKWLKEVQLVMLESMHEQIRKSYDTYWSDIRQGWVLKWPGQVITCVSCLTWTEEVEESIDNNTLPNYLEKCSNQIKELVELVRGTLSKCATIAIEALIVLDVHSRDIVQYLIEKNVTDNGDFNWFSQLRYYWKIDPIDKQDYISASMVSTDVRYGMEYLGNQPRLVVTPLTDRCYRTLMGAYRLNLGGAPEGPAGTGKTETCKDLAKAVAKKCVVFNCSDGLDYKALGKFFKGLAQSGSWACFDEFNRIEIEVLSVVAQQILTIQRAIARKVVKFIFEDTTLQIDPTCNIFITMNPGYAGRTELPDNLKVLFRTVAMMVPDYAMIGEITLYSNGFDSARTLSQKIVHTYKLCSEQLSSQHHYDYGMRAVKSVLIASGTLRKLYPDLTEEKIVLRAIIDVNLPKFLQQDVPLFQGIYTDLFPGVEIPQPAREDVTKWLHIKINEKKLQPTPWFIEKIMQIYEMLLVRHGIMIVGGSMSGKTTAYQLLAEILQEVKKDPDTIVDEHGVNYKIINPKAISIGQLYGCFDPVSHEWTDGVLAKTFREMAYYDTKERQWIVFDGPVDAIWIENLNTALDDNKKLCLMSGEIIQMSRTMNLFFETASLEQASPATVSRAGMIYMEASQLGWEALHKSFIYQLENISLNEIYMGLYEELVEWLIPATIEFIASCKVVLELSPMHCYRIFSTFFLIFLTQTPQYNQNWFQQTFLFCLAWSYGSTLTTDGKKEFDALIRKVLYGANDLYPKSKHFSLNRGQMYPEKQTALDFFFEGENWWPWLKTDDVTFSAEAQVTELMVPTKETGFINYWLEICMKKSLPIILVGPTGTGKSATIYSYMIKLPKEKFILNTVNFSAKTSASQVQEIIMSKLDRRRKGAFGPPVGKTYLMFVDDIAMPARDPYGSQPPIELLRQWMDHKYWFDLKDSSKFEISDMMIVSAMGLAGGSNFIYPRIYRHMFVMAVDAFEDTTIVRIFSKIGEWHFSKGYSENISKFPKNLSGALVEIFRESKSCFLPTPAKSHYMFSLRDVSKVFQGIVLVPAKRLATLEKLTRLWVHETLRVFSDRLIEQSDKDILIDLLKTACNTNLRLTLDQAFGDKLEKGQHISDEHMRDLQFGNYMEPDADPRIYDEIEDLTKLENVMAYYLSEFNSNSNSPMDLVLFRFALEHISRVSRVFHMPRGNILLVGLGGSGRRSSVKLAASMADLDLIQVEIKKSYTINDWREDIKKILLHAGIDAKPTVFLFCDSQAKDESFIEDINTLLNTGDLPNLFQSEEKATILEKMQTAAKNLNKTIDTTPLALYGFFIDRIRESLHIALAFSPIGDSFKKRLRIYPSLINCCTIDWFSTWPNDALLRVAEHFIRSVNLSNDIIDDDDDENNESNLSIPNNAPNIVPERKLSKMELKLVEMVLALNLSVVNANERFYAELGRKNYVTPTSYLEMLRLFKVLYDKKYDEITVQRNRYTTGLEKLGSAAGQVAIMQENLYELQPQLKITSEETERIMVNIERETAEAEKKKEVVGADESAANEAAAAAQAIKDDCESDLQEAIPAMEAALAALDTLKPADITLVKSMKNPPAGVKLVLEAVCVMKGFKADRKPDATGRMIEDYWGPSVKMLNDMKFLESLKSFDKDNIPGPIMKKIRDTYIADRDFVPEKIKNISTACEGLCRWTRAIEIYDRVAKIVAPKKIALAEAETELGQQMEKLNSKRAELQVILDKLQKLNDFFAEKSREKKRLEDEIDNCEKKLIRAEKLLGGLGGEKVRWSESASNLHKSLGNIVGDVLLAAGCVAYLGCFTTEYRAEILTHWNESCLKEEIPCSANFSLAITLGNPMQIRSWTLCGLPIDMFSIENGIIVTNTRRWPLMIDPQVQANKWIKNMEKENNLHVIKLTDTHYLRIVENSIRQGLPVLLENIGEFIDFSLFTVLEKNVVKQKGGYFIKFGDGMIEYNHNFRFYITSCLSNPHYLPETAVMVTLLNFAITEQGLREQLLATVVIQERPDLQEKKEQLIVESARNRDTLYTIESKILQVLSSSEGNILEDENAINILSSSKLLSEEIEVKQIVAAATEEEIDSSRQMYIPVSQNSAVLFFCITELANIDPMYQYSLSWFLNLFIQTIARAPKSDVLTERLDSLNHFFTRSIYENVCRSLFEKDKLVFSFVMCIGILRSQMKIDEIYLEFFLTGGIGLDNPHPNPAEEWLTDKTWSDIVRSSNLNGIPNFYNDFMENIKEWKDFYDLTNPQDFPFPGGYSNLDQLLKLIILKCIRPDKIVPAVRKFIITNMDEFFVEPPNFNLSASFNDSSTKIPLIFVLSSGLDPMSNLLAYAKEKNMYDKCKTISLGQGQGPRAEKLISDGIKYGHWIVLQNCHVAASWMDDLEKICLDTIDLDYIHSNYRLWLTSYPSKIFPVSILQNSVKMTNESPKGLKMNILKALNSDPLNNDKFFSNAFIGDTSKYWLRGVFSILFFHAVIQERREFGPLGWNIPYEFNESDLRISVMQLKAFLKQYEKIPFEGHKYLTGECNYGGRVTDDKDRRLLMTLLDHLYNENAVNIDNYSLSESGMYTIPLAPTVNNSIAFVQTLPIVTHPEVFGLHENADISKNMNETNTLLLGVFLTQTQLKSGPKSGDSGQGSGGDPVLNFCADIINRLPNLFDIETVSKKYPVLYNNSMNTVLRQELIRFNRLLEYIKLSLIDVTRAISGQIALIPEIESVYNAISIGRIPDKWAKQSYPSLKPLGSYINDLLSRLQVFERWIESGEPSIHWLSGFYFTQSFITGVLQNFSRKNSLQIDLISIQFEVTNYETEADSEPEVGVYIRGIFLEGARWNRITKSLDESYPKLLFDKLPIITMKPVLKTELPIEKQLKYDSPIYKTTARRGELSTTGHSTNFVMFMELNTILSPNHWIKRGTACLCQLDD